MSFIGSDSLQKCKCDPLMKKYLFFVYTLLYIVIGLFGRFHWLPTLIIYFVWLPFWCSWMFKSVAQETADQDLELEERCVAKSSSDSPLVSDPCLQRLLCDPDAEVTFEIELTVNVETTINKLCEKQEGGCCVVEEVDCSGEENPDKEESSKEEEDKVEKFSLDLVPLEFLYMTMQ